MSIAATTVPGTTFEVPVEILMLGLITGLTYALLAMGLVLVYRTSRVINFAHGEIGALPALLVPVLVVVHGLNYWLALFVALVTAAAAGALTEYVAVRKLARAPRLVVLVATIGMSQVFFAIGASIPKEGELGSATFPTPFQAGVQFADLILTPGYLLILGVTPVLAVGLLLFLKGTTLGLASRASSENADGAKLAGIPVSRISLLVWILAGTLAGVAAILLGPTLPIATREALGPGLMLRALTAAMIGGMTRIPLAFAGGIGVGLLELLVRWNYPTGGTVEVALFAVIILSFLLSRHLGQAARGGEESSWSLAGTVRVLGPHAAQLPKVRGLRYGAIGLAVAVAVTWPLSLSSSAQVTLSTVVLLAVMGLSLTILTGYTGQVSLGQFAFVGLAAVVGGRMLHLGYPAWMALLYSVAAGGVMALLLGLPALRIRGLYLAVITLGFGVASHAWIYQQEWLVSVTGGQSSLSIPRPVIFGVAFDSELRYYWLCLGVLVAVAVLVHNLRNSGLGRSMMAVRDNERAAAGRAIKPRRVKLTAFIISGMIASMAGFFYGGLLVNFSDPGAFGPENSLMLLAMVIIGGVTTIMGAILGAVAIQGLGTVIEPLLPQLLGPNLALLVAGLLLLLAVLRLPSGLAGEVIRARDRIVTRMTGHGKRPGDPEQQHAIAAPRLDAAAAGDTEEIWAPDEIEARDITVTFSGNTVVDAVSLRADDGEILGLVGPNGAGKTTLIDVLTGQLRPDAGQVLLNGRDVTRLRPEQRAAQGLGRTFQQAKLFGEMTVFDTVKVSFECTEPAETVPSLLGLPPSRAAEEWKTLEAADLLDLFGLGPYAHRHVGELSTGMRRFCELATLVALGSRVLLLDEPTAGIAQSEVEAFKPVLADIRDHLGATVVMIEHDIPLIMSLADRLAVLAAGRLIAEGPPETVRRDPAVIAAYLGSDESVIARSGTYAST